MLNYNYKMILLTMNEDGIIMADPEKQYKEQQLKKKSKQVFAVAASPFNAIKLELPIILILGFLLWAVLNSITDNDLTHIVVLFLYSLTGAIWLSLRIRFVSRQVDKN